MTPRPERGGLRVSLEFTFLFVAFADGCSRFGPLKLWRTCGFGIRQRIERPVTSSRLVVEGFGHPDRSQSS
jgi:hypothetical protein